MSDIDDMEAISLPKKPGGHMKKQLIITAIALVTLAETSLFAAESSSKQVPAPQVNQAQEEAQKASAKPADHNMKFGKKKKGSHKDKGAHLIKANNSKA